MELCTCTHALVPAAPHTTNTRKGSHQQKNMLSSSTWVDARALKYAQKKYRYRNPYFDRRYRGLVKIAIVVGLLGAGILYKNRRAVEKRLHPLLLSRDDDAQYGNEYDFSHELAGRHSSHPERPDHEKANEVCSTGLLSDEGRWPGVRACCAPHCAKCAASEDKACNAPGIIRSGIVCRGPFDSQCVWPEDHEAHKHKYRGSALTLPAGEPTDYELDSNSPLLKCSTLSCLDAAISELPVSRRRAYVLHMDPSIYQLGDPTRGSSVPLAPQLSYLPKRLVVHFGMRLRLRDNSEVLALGGAVTGVRVYCVVVACRDGDALPDTVELVPFTSVADIMGHSDADVAQAARAYRKLWRADPVLRDVSSAMYASHRTFDQS